MLCLSVGKIIKIMQSKDAHTKKSSLGTLCQEQVSRQFRGSFEAVHPAIKNQKFSKNSKMFAFCLEMIENCMVRQSRRANLYVHCKCVSSAAQGGCRSFNLFKARLLDLWTGLSLLVLLSVISIDLSIYLSVFQSTSLKTYLPTYLPFYLSFCLSCYIYLSIYLSVCLSIYQSIYLSIFRSIYLSICPSHLSVCLSVYESICLYLSISIWLPVYLSFCLPSSAH